MDIKYTYLIIILCIFIYYYNINSSLDNDDKKKLLYIPEHTGILNIPAQEVLKIEQVIKNYNKKKDLNLSRVYEIKSDMYTGFLSGLLVGLITNMPLQGICINSVMYGIVAGSVKSIRLLNENSEFLIKDRYI